MKLMKPFDSTQHDPTQSGGQLPVGKMIKVVIVNSEVMPTKSKDGGLLKLDLEVIEGEHKGATGVHRLNLYHSNPQTVEIANKQLSGICHVVSVFKVNDSAQLHNIPFCVDVAQQQDPKYTEVKKVYDVNGNEPGKQTPTTTTQPQTQPQAEPQQTQSAPWGGGGGQTETQSLQEQSEQQATPPWGAGGGQPATTPPWGNNG